MNNFPLFLSRFAKIDIEFENQEKNYWKINFSMLNFPLSRLERVFHGGFNEKLLASMLFAVLFSFRELSCALIAVCHFHTHFLSLFRLKFSVNGAAHLG